ncbi:hypothetical protein O6H91_09G105000 [Diphasiastrum complanatum]|uniref:Uncharacterized protein n=1 Tax=Diphasiastrum complanatum TaxID=34168 RepID=A0ACC2CSS0_DIPCM|nr:hypothetical protein O6H91_Y244700 [Diphasiastrum complanatum]KAJ7294612.1 hypothetical protein O6H91_Y244700 [Diphasiastrum complanatum]KAJ7545059.1 hypothetical protein O6H91_09G105000 [Diphasiastrum complanatum]
MERSDALCEDPECLFCILKETDLSKSHSRLARLFQEFPSHGADGQVVVVSQLRNIAMTYPTQTELIQQGIFECMSGLIWKGLRNRQWLAQDQNVYIPYYAAHIIGSYTLLVEESAERAVKAGVIPPLLELLRGKLTWVEQRIAVRALAHIAAYDSTFPSVAAHKDVLEHTIQLAQDAFSIVYTHYYQFVDCRLQYHSDLLTTRSEGVSTESRAEEWASQLQCWSLQLINCFAFGEAHLPIICQQEFLSKLSGMWGGLVNVSSPAGLGLLRTICHHSFGRAAIASCTAVVEALCSTARSSDDWQHMAIDCLMWLVQDPDTQLKVLDKALVALADLAELPSLEDNVKVGDMLMSSLNEDFDFPSSLSLSPCTRELLDGFMASRERLKWEKSMSTEDLQEKLKATLLVKSEGDGKILDGDIAGAVIKYTEALALCPINEESERLSLYSKRAECHLILHKPDCALSDSTRVLCLHKPINRHCKSLWQRAQAFDALGMAKESLFDAIMFINEWSHEPEHDNDLKDIKVLEQFEHLITKQMHAAWLFCDPAIKHGPLQYSMDDNVSITHHHEDYDESVWETASESDLIDVGEDFYWEEEKNNIESTESNIIKQAAIFRGITLKDLFGHFVPTRIKQISNLQQDSIPSTPNYTFTPQ